MKRRMGNSRAYVASFTPLNKKAKADSCRAPEYRKHSNNITARSEDHVLKNTTKDKGASLPCVIMNENAKSTADCEKKWRMESSLNNVHRVESALLTEKHVELENKLQILKPSQPNKVCVQPDGLRSTCMETVLEEGEIRVEPNDSRFHEDHTLGKQDQETCIGISINDNLSYYMQEIENVCAKRMCDLLLQQTVEKDKFKMFMEKEKLKMEKKNVLKSDLGNSLIDHPYARHGNLCPLSRQSPYKLTGFHQYFLSQKRKLVALQIDARNKEKNLKQKWMADAYHGKLVGAFDAIPLSCSEFRAESFEEVCCWGEASCCSRNITSSVILPDEQNNVNSSTSKDASKNNPDGKINPVTTSGMISNNDGANSIPEKFEEACWLEETLSSPRNVIGPFPKVDMGDLHNNIQQNDLTTETCLIPSSVPEASSEMILQTTAVEMELANPSDRSVSDLATVQGEWQVVSDQMEPKRSSQLIVGSEEMPFSSYNNASRSVEKEQGLKSPQLSASELQPAENVNLEDPPLRNLVTGANAHLQSVFHVCCGSTSNQQEPNVSHPFMITTNLQTNELCVDPFQNELLRIKKEEELVILMDEKMKLQLKIEFDNELQKLQKKYSTLLKNTEAAALSKKKSLEIIFDKLQKNQVIAEQFLSNFFETSVATPSNNRRIALVSKQQHPPGPASSLPALSTRFS